MEAGQNQKLLNRELIVQVLGQIVSKILQETIQLQSTFSTKFHTSKIPAVTIGDYLKRIAKYAHCSDSVLIIALIYLDRMQERNVQLVLTSNCIHRLLITAVMLAAKVHDDFYYKNQYYAKVGGIAQPEINLLEREFIELVSYDFFVTPSLFWAYHQKIVNYLALAA